MQGRKLYVGNLNYATTDQELEELFSQCGEVLSVNLITDRSTGRAKGFGFVEMSSPSEAERAKDTLNGTDFKGRTMKVDEARPQQNKQRRGFRRY